MLIPSYAHIFSQLFSIYLRRTSLCKIIQLQYLVKGLPCMHIIKASSYRPIVAAEMFVSGRCRCIILKPLLADDVLISSCIPNCILLFIYVFSHLLVSFSKCFLRTILGHYLYTPLAGRITSDCV